jgi:hypothetical protein
MDMRPYRLAKQMARLSGRSHPKLDLRKQVPPEGRALLVRNSGHSLFSRAIRSANCALPSSTKSFWPTVRELSAACPFPRTFAREVCWRSGLQAAERSVFSTM